MKHAGYASSRLHRGLSLDSRRRFLFLSARALGAAALVPSTLLAGSQSRSARPLRILILGGTGFLGPACTESALARGHSVTHFNSGRTEEARKDGGRPSVVPAGVVQLYGNRDPNKTADDRRTEGKAALQKDPNSPKGLSQLEGKQWDAVIDTSGYFPRMVRASAELLAPSVGQYLFISSISVYRDTKVPHADETAPILTLEDPKTEDMGKDYVNYGGGKAMCEQAAEAAMPGRVTNVRPGYMVGPRDTSGRFLYWPVRASLGGTMAVPGMPTDPIQLIDVRDVADWLIHCAERKVVGVYNVTGPGRELTMKGMVKAVRKGVGSACSFSWLDTHFLETEGVGLGPFPLYAPPVGDTAGFHRCSIQRALRQGLAFRPLALTARDTLGWYRDLPAELQKRVAPQFAEKAGERSWLDREKELLEKWRAHKTR